MSEIMPETAFDELREGLSLRAARREWVEDSAGGRACGVNEVQAEAAERDEVRRAQKYQKRVKAHYGREVSIQAARAAVRGRQLTDEFADLSAPEGAPNSLSGTTAEVVAQLRRDHPEWRITWSPEQPSQSGPLFGGLAYGPGSVTPIGDEAMSADVMARRERDLNRTIG